ncbi:MAG: hypothetical protein J6M18_05475 [Actinomycetaceae bacterium]|nr:hypothetical protein [Actinomycetaceae bacterium]
MSDILRINQDMTDGVGWQACDKYDYCEVYDFPSQNLDTYSGIIIGSSCDQIFLHEHSHILNAWVKNGGKILVNGHPVLPFLENMPQWRKLFFHGVDDIWLHSLEKHPIFDGVDMTHMLMRTGVPGNHTFEEMRDKYGVGGFYARNYMVNLPSGAKVITGIGTGHLPIDISYPLGNGEVIMHSGIDLDFFNTQFFGCEYDMRARVIDYFTRSNK